MYSSTTRIDLGKIGAYNWSVKVTSLEYSHHCTAPEKLKITVNDHSTSNCFCIRHGRQGWSCSLHCGLPPYWLNSESLVSVLHCISVAVSLKGGAAEMCWHWSIAYWLSLMRERKNPFIHRFSSHIKCVFSSPWFKGGELPYYRTRETVLLQWYVQWPPALCFWWCNESTA